MEDADQQQQLMPCDEVESHVESTAAVVPELFRGNGSRSNTEIVRASIGQRVTFSTSAHRLSIATVDPKVAGAWRDGTLQFVGRAPGGRYQCNQSLHAITNCRGAGISADTIHRYVTVKSPRLAQGIGAHICR
jgi:hypothetical protein